MIGYFGVVLTLLKVAGTAIVLIGLLHVLLGLRADRLLDNTVPETAIKHPSLDSQNRFYGAAFAVFGVLLWLCASDMTRYGPVFRTLMIVFFLAGAARFISAAVMGLPSRIVRILWLLEVGTPPLLLWWQAAR